MSNNTDDNEALIKAARDKDWEGVRKLIAAGADVNVRDENGWAVLMLAARYNENQAFVKELIAAGADVNAKTKIGKTALMFAANNNANPEVIKELIAAGADVNAKGKWGDTALMNAAKDNENPEIVKELLAVGAEVNAEDKDGKTALMQAAFNENPAVIKELLAAGADVNAKTKDRWGDTALLRAAEFNNNPEVIKELIVAGADVNVEDKDGKTALMHAAEDNKNPEVFKELLAAGADVNAKDKDGRTALIFAAEYDKNPEIVRELIAAGADVNVKDDNGKTVRMKIDELENWVKTVKAFIDDAGKDSDGRSSGIDLNGDFPNDIIRFSAGDYEVNQAKFKGKSYYFGYKFNADISSKDKKEFIEYIKGISEKKIAPHTLRQFIELPLASLFKKLDFNLAETGALVYPLSGRSPLVKTIIKITNEFLQHGVKGYSFELVKNAPVNIAFDFDAFERDFGDNFNYSQMIKHVKEDILPKIHSLDYFSLARDVKPKYRPYISDYLGFPDIASLNRFSALRDEKNILIIDDVNTTGSTLNEILRIITKVNPYGNVYIFTLLGK